MNSIMTLHVCNYNGVWAFDDLNAGLVKEPFVAGIPEIIEHVLKKQNITNAHQKGFMLMFSSSPFPSAQFKLFWQREEMGGNYYKLEATDMEGWLCPALFKYFDKAPDYIYVQVTEVKK